MASTSVVFDILARDRASDKFQKVGNSAEKTAAQLRKFGKVGAAGLAVAATATAAAGVAIFKTGSQYVSSLNKIQTLTGASSKQMKDVSRQLEGNSHAYARMGMTTGDAAAGVVELTKAGMKLHPALKSIQSTMVLAKAGEIGVADAASLVSNTLNVFKLKAGDAAKVANTLANAANVSSADVSDLQQALAMSANVAAGSGASFKQTAAMLAELSNAGMQGSDAGTSLKTMLLSLQAPSSIAAKNLKAIGVSAFDSSGKAREIRDVLGDLDKQFKGMSDQARAKALKNIFGSDAFRAARVIFGNGAAELDKYTKAVGKAGAAQRLADSQSRGLAGTFNMAKSEVVSFAQQLYREFSPALDQRLRPAVAWFGEQLPKAIPAIHSFIAQLQSGEGFAGRLATAFTRVSTALAATFTWVMNNKATVGTFVTIIGTAVAISKAWAIAQLALNAAMTANPIGLVVVGLAALAAGLVYAYKHSEKFRSIVQGAFAVVKAAASGVVGFFTGPVPAAFNKVKSAASSVLNWVKGNWPYLVGALAGPFGIAAVAIAKHWDGIKNGAKNVVSKVTSFFQGLPGKILSAVGNLGSLLYNAGASIIQGLINGIQSKVNQVTGILRNLTNKIPDWKGPLDRDRTLLTPAGEAIMQSLINGFKKKWTPVKDFLQKVTDKVKETGDKLAGLVSQRNDFASGFRSFSSSIFGRDPGQDAQGNANPESVAGIKAFALKQRQDADTLARNVQRLVGLGLSKSLLTQLQSQGSSGVAQINALAGASKSDIAFLNQQDKATTAANQRAGMAAANAIYGADIKKAQQDNAAVIKALHDMRDELRHLSNGKLHAEIHGDQLVLVIRRDLKKKGKRDPFS